MGLDTCTEGIGAWVHEAGFDTCVDEVLTEMT